MRLSVRIALTPPKCTDDGTVNIFDARGELQVIVTEMQQGGQGSFYIQFEKTRKKLEPLGYFLPEHKKPIPAFPSQISVVTGANTAALQDIRITITKRWPNITLREEYAIVQGREAIESIITALKKADEHGSDVIILARGGGSVDDLWCFNDEKIAETIYNLKTPIITGIGHEIDTTIADLVADRRAATPTAERAWASPKTAPNNSEAPLITPGWPKKSGLDDTKPTTFTQPESLSSPPAA